MNSSSHCDSTPSMGAHEFSVTFSMGWDATGRCLCRHTKIDFSRTATELHRRTVESAFLFRSCSVEIHPKTGIAINVSLISTPRRAKHFLNKERNNHEDNHPHVTLRKAYPDPPKRDVLYDGPLVVAWEVSVCCFRVAK